LALVALAIQMVQIPFFQQSHQQVVALVGEMEQLLETQVGLVAVLVDKQHQGLMETLLAHHHRKVITEVRV
jgi:hypothetical protein